jgi:hypothetical protein
VWVALLKHVARRDGRAKPFEAQDRQALPVQVRPSRREKGQHTRVRDQGFGCWAQVMPPLVVL